MSDTPVPPNLGVSVPADPAAIEAALRAYWKSASPGDGEGAAVRSCSCNLVVIVCGAEEAADAMRVLAAVSEWHPHRSVVVWTAAQPDSGPSAPGMRAWIGAQCVLPARSPIGRDD